MKALITAVAILTASTAQAGMTVNDFCNDHLAEIKRTLPGPETLIKASMMEAFTEAGLDQLEPHYHAAWKAMMDMVRTDTTRKGLASPTNDTMILQRCHNIDGLQELLNRGDSR